jgi:transcriptional regulator with GAF, ATPase, and Fis domain
LGTASALLAAFRNLVRMSKLSDLPVLITGIRNRQGLLLGAPPWTSDRSARSLPSIARINAGVAESELFGHARAHSLAPATTTTVFLAAKGVLFLDEIGELNPDVQARSCACCRKASLPRQGRQRCADRRHIVAATNQDLAQMMNDGRFRRIFHRLIRFRFSSARCANGRGFAVAGRTFRIGAPTEADLSRIDRDLIDACPASSSGNVRELQNLITTALAAKTDTARWSSRTFPHRYGKNSRIRIADSAAEVSSSVATGRHAEDDRSMLPDMQSRRQRNRSAGMERLPITVNGRSSKPQCADQATISPRLPGCWASPPRSIYP